VYFTRIFTVFFCTKIPSYWVNKSKAWQISQAVQLTAIETTWCSPLNWNQYLNYRAIFKTCKVLYPYNTTAAVFTPGCISGSSRGCGGSSGAAVVAAGTRLETRRSHRRSNWRAHRPSCSRRDTSLPWLTSPWGSTQRKSSYTGSLLWVASLWLCWACYLNF